jgi:NADH-quinone oxidoreductase subunit N
MSGFEIVQPSDLGAVLLILIMVLFGLASLLVGSLFRRGTGMSAWISAVGFILTGTVCAISLGRGERAEGFASGYVLDDLTYGLVLPCAVAGLLSILLSLRYLQSLKHGAGEFCGLMALATAGMAVMAGAQDLVVGFFGVELLSVPLYIMAAYSRRDRLSNEAGLKYLMIGSVSSAILVFGIALSYAALGTTNIIAMADGRLAAGAALAESPFTSVTALVGLGLIIVGLGFKAALVPFHMWCPDVYQGAPTPVTTFFSVGPKVATVGLLYRVLLVGFGGLAEWWAPVLGVVAVLTMTVGNLGALLQPQGKRMLAYSGIAHAGYMLLAVIGAGVLYAKGSDDWAAASVAIVFYGLSYSFMNLGAFAAISQLGPSDLGDVDLDRLKGLHVHRPFAAAGLTLFMISLTGIPITAGFWGKLSVFSAALSSGAGWVWAIVIIAAINSAISAYYYLRPVAYSYMWEPEAGESGETWIPTQSGSWVMAAAGIGVLGLALLPAVILNAADAIGQSLLPPP